MLRLTTLPCQILLGYVLINPAIIIALEYIPGFIKTSSKHAAVDHSPASTLPRRIGQFGTDSNGPFLLGYVLINPAIIIALEYIPGFIKTGFKHAAVDHSPASTLPRRIGQFGTDSNGQFLLGYVLINPAIYIHPFSKRFS